MEYTGGKWEIFNVDGTIGISTDISGKGDICFTYEPSDERGFEGKNTYDSQRSTEESLANAQRIVACVNACEGVETEDLNHWNLKRKTVFDTQAELNDATNLLEIAIAERDKARSVKDTLLESLKTILDPECMEDIRLLIKEAEEGKDNEN